MNIAEIKTKARINALRKVRIYDNTYTLLGVVSTLEYYYWVCYDDGKIRYFSVDAKILFTPKQGMKKEEWDDKRNSVKNSIRHENYKIEFLK